MMIVSLYSSLACQMYHGLRTVAQRRISGEGMVARTGLFFAPPPPNLVFLMLRGLSGCLLDIILCTLDVNWDNVNFFTKAVDIKYFWMFLAGTYWSYENQPWNYRRSSDSPCLGLCAPSKCFHRFKDFKILEVSQH